MNDKETVKLSLGSLKYAAINGECISEIDVNNVYHELQRLWAMEQWALEKSLSKSEETPREYMD